MTWFISHVFKKLYRLIVPTNKTASKLKLRWIYSPLLKQGGHPKCGYSSAGATGAGRATRSDGHKSCSDAMAEASGSSSRPRTGGAKKDDRPEMFAREDTNGTRYMKMTGEMMISLIKDEQNGAIVLPAKIEGTPNNVTLGESWLPYGIPFVVIAGLVLSKCSH